MRLLSLNLWGGAQGQPLLDYIKAAGKNMDIFCFQEVFIAKAGTPKTHQGYNLYLYQDLTACLEDFVPYFEAKSRGYADDGREKSSWQVSHGIALFARKNFVVESYQAKIIGDSVAAGGPLIEGDVNAQALTLSLDKVSLNIVNTHGMSHPGHKLDTPQRLEQSRRILDIISALPKAPVILCGDLNLMPETQSIKMFESAAMRNLIKAYNIANTRNKVSWQRHSNPQYFADYTFVSPEIKVKNFEVPYNEVSDHLPMILDFSL